MEDRPEHGGNLLRTLRHRLGELDTDDRRPESSSVSAPWHYARHGMPKCRPLGDDSGLEHGEPRRFETSVDSSARERGTSGSLEHA
jgi:hypothetical protein